LKIKAKSKLEEHILSHLTPEGEFLDLEDKNVTPEHLRLLCQAGETLQGVKQLYLSNNGLGDAEIEFLSKSRCLPNLEKLKKIGSTEWEITFSTKEDMRAAIFDFANTNGLKIVQMNSKNKNLESLFRELTL